MRTRARQPVPRRRRDGALRRPDRPRGPRRIARCAPRWASRPAWCRFATTCSSAHGIDFRVRIGINTDPVVVGAIGRDLRMDYTAVGDTTNLASRILNIAAVRADRAQREHASPDRRLFRLRRPRRVPGQGQGRADQACGPCPRSISGRTRLEVSRERGLTPLIGRDRELERLATGYPAGRQRLRRDRRAGRRARRRQVSADLRVPARPGRSRRPRARGNGRLVWPRDSVPPDPRAGSAVPGLEGGDARRGDPAARGLSASRPRPRGRRASGLAGPLPRRPRAPASSSIASREPSSRSGRSACFATSSSARAGKRRSCWSWRTSTGSIRAPRSSSSTSPAPCRVTACCWC